jgi:hypothetical protein
VDYKHFLHGYNPVLPPHQLEGTLTLRDYDRFLRTEADAENAAMAAAAQHPWSVESKNLLQKQSLAKTTSSLDSPSPFLTMDGIEKSLAKAASRSRAQDDMLYDTLKSSTTNFEDSAASSKQQPVNDDLRRIWQAVLRECHRSDPDRSGQVSRTAFIGALEKANFGKVSESARLAMFSSNPLYATVADNIRHCFLIQTMTAQAMNQLADSYTLSSGLINYLSCFRTFLNDLAGTETSSSTNAQSLSRSASLPADAFEASGPPTLLLRPIHPWDFDYKRERHAVPYWKTAVAMPKDLEALKNAPPPTYIPTPAEKSVADFTNAEKSALLAQYSPKILDICTKSYKQFEPIWRDLRNQFVKAQIISQRGSIQVHHFLAIMENNGILLSKGELGAIVRTFRGAGMQEVVKFDEFFRVCLLMKGKN